MAKFKKKFRQIPLTVKVSMSYAICSILQKCLSFITLPLFTRLLTTEQYGQYTIYSSWSGILMIFLTLNLAYGSFQTAMAKYDDRRNEYISSIQGICLLLSAIFLIVYLPFRKQWNTLFELPTFFVLLMTSEILFSTSTSLWMGKNRFEFKYKSVISITLLISVLSPLIAYLLVGVTQEKGYARILGYAGTNIVVGIIIFCLNIVKGKKIFNKEFWKYALSFNIPLLAYYLSQVVFNQSDRIMISHITGSSDAAMYGVAYNLAMIMTFVLNAINGSYVPWLYGKIKQGKAEENKSISLILVILMGLIILGVIWYAPEIIIIMAGKKYAAAIYVVAPVSMSLLLLFYCQLFINIEFYYEEKKMLVYGSVSAALINIILNAILIPRVGFVAAGYTTLVSYMVFAISNLYTMRKVLKRRQIKDNMYNYKALLGIFIVFLCAGFLGVALYGNLIIRIIITLIVLGIFILKRDNFFKTLRKIKDR